MRKRMYMHTIDRLPAFYDGQQVSFMNHGFRGRAGNQLLALTLEQLRAEQKASKQWRRKQGFSDHAEDYGYVVVAINS